MRTYKHSKVFTNFWVSSILVFGQIVLPSSLSARKEVRAIESVTLDIPTAWKYIVDNDEIALFNILSRNYINKAELREKYIAHSVYRCPSTDGLAIQAACRISNKNRLIDGYAIKSANDLSPDQTPDKCIQISEAIHQISNMTKTGRALIPIYHDNILDFVNYLPDENDLRIADMIGVSVVSLSSKLTVFFSPSTFAVPDSCIEGLWIFKSR